MLSAGREPRVEQFMPLAATGKAVPVGIVWQKPPPKIPPAHTHTCTHSWRTHGLHQGVEPQTAEAEVPEQH